MRKRDVMRRFVTYLVVFSIFSFLLMPIVLIVATSFATSPALSFPPSGFTLRWYQRIQPDFLNALKDSFIVAVSTTALATLVGTPAALALVRGRFPGRTLLNTFCLSPLLVPTLVLGVAAFQFSGLVWDVFGYSANGTIVGLALAHGAFTIPFVIRAAMAGQAHFDTALEECSMNLGATPTQTFFRVTLPIIAPGVAAGAIFAFIMSFDDVPVALFMGGGGVTTLPVKIFTTIEFDFDNSVMAIGAIVVAMSLLMMVLLDWLVGLDRFLGVAR